MKFIKLSLLVLAVTAHKLEQKTTDEVDDLMNKQDEKDAKAVADKEFNDADSKMNQVGSVSKQHQSAEDDDYMKSVFDQYAKAGTDKRGNSNGVDMLTKDNAYQASFDIIQKWNDLPDQNTKAYLADRFDTNWEKVDINHQGFIDATEAFQFER